MSLYYEADPADETTPPQLPPLLRAEAVDTGDVQAKAVARAAAGEVGLVCYAQSGPLLDFAITLAPEVDAAAASQMHHALMVAVGDAIGALAPPEVVVTYQFPGTLLFNRGIAGAIRLVQGRWPRIRKPRLGWWCLPVCVSCLVRCRPCRWSSAWPTPR